MCIPTLSLALALATSGVARAQVNTENLRKRVKVVGYTFLLEGSLTADAGNTEGIAAGGGIGGGVASERHLAFAYARADYSRYGGVTSVNKTFAHARYNYEVTPGVWGEVFAQAQSDQFQRLALRSLLGIGPRFQIVHTAVPQDFDVYLGTSYMLERDAIKVAPGAPDESVQLWQRWNTYATVQWQVDERVIVATTLYAQPAIPDYGNVRVLSESIATFKITKLLTASISGTVRYDSAPPTDVKTADAEIKNTLALTF